MMAGINIAVSLLVVFLAGEVTSTLDSRCTDISYYDALQYTTSAKPCCKPQLKEFCENKSEEVCKDVVEVQCEPKARVECRTETSFAEGKKCSVELQHYDYKDCNKKVTARIDCKLETVKSCKPKIKIDQDGSPKFNGDLSCTDLVYEKCVVVDDAVSGCSKQELDSLCACGDEASSPVCAGGLLYDNQCKYECKKKRDQCAFPSREFPALGDIAECVSQDAKDQFENVRLPGRAAATEVADSPTCTTPFQVKWADYTETAKAMTTQETVCEVKKSVECKRVSVNKCTVLDWEECSWRPVQQCEAVFVSEPSQEKVHQKKCLNTGSSSSTSASSGSRFSPNLSLGDRGSSYYSGGQG